MNYRQCGKSGILLPEISLGLWHNFGATDDYAEARAMVIYAFEHGVCHFDLANNYGPPAGSAESNFGKILRSDLHTHRDEIFISSKAGHEMWPGVYGDGSSRKNLIASCDASLRRTGLEYFDVFYSHRYDGFTPVEETMGALISIVRSGKALYAGISKYPPEQQQQAYTILKEAGVPCLVSQYRASIFDTKAMEHNFDAAHDAGSGIVCFSPLAQGLLTGKYLHGIPENSRAAKPTGFLQAGQVTEARVHAARELDTIARRKGDSLAAMSINYLLADSRVTSVIVGASSVRQLKENISGINSAGFTTEELTEIYNIAHHEGVQF